MYVQHILSVYTYKYRENSSDKLSKWLIGSLQDLQQLHSRGSYEAFSPPISEVLLISSSHFFHNFYLYVNSKENKPNASLPCAMVLSKTDWSF